MSRESKASRITQQIADRIVVFREMHYGFKPKYVYMTEDLHKALTGRKTLRYEEEFCGVKIKLFHSDGLKFFLVQDVFEVSL
jgi:hypothetical protein